MIINDYQYDLINHPYLSEVRDEGDGATLQVFNLPAGVSQICGFRIKVSRYGSPGPIQFQLGTVKIPEQYTGSATPILEEVLAEGQIQPDQVLPVFELLVGSEFDPIPVQNDRPYGLKLWVKAGKKPLHAYRFFGPNTSNTTGGPQNIQLPYWWYEEYEIDEDMDIPLPHDYQGAGLPPFPGANRFQEDGSQVWNLSFAFLTEPGEQILPGQEQTFEFTRRLLAPPYEEWKLLRDPTRPPQPDEVWIDESWAIQLSCPTDPILENTVTELRHFFSKVQGIELSPGGGKKSLVFGLDHHRAPAGNESFSLSVRETGIDLSARSTRGLMRAVHWLEDQMLFARAPALKSGEYHLQDRYRLRMVPGIYPAPAYYQLEEELVWTPGYLWRLARAGYNAIYLPANLEEFVVKSDIFPEMDHAHAPVAIEHLRKLTEMAAEYGIDVYIDLKTGYFKPFPEAIYNRLPQIRTFKKWGNHPCSGQQITLDFYRETLSGVFKAAPKLKGLIVIYDTEGFYSCFLHNRKDRCHYCKDYTVEELSSRLFDTLQQAILAGREDAELVLWSYFCDEPWNEQVIRAMPGSVTLMACFSQYQELNRFGARILTDDYSVSSEMPSQYFLKLQGLAAEKGLRFICKTEDTFGQEFVSTPYTPCLEQHQRRWDQVHLQHVDGFMSQYVHLGFVPNPCADLTRQNMYRIEKDGDLLEMSDREKLERTAAIRYGRAAVSPIVQAWQSFSTAIRNYFPYTWGVCRYPGPLQAAPAQPFHLDPNQKMPRLRSRGYVNDLRWTRIEPRFLVNPDQRWDAELVSRCLQNFRHLYRDGIQSIEAAAILVDPPYRGAWQDLLNVSQTQYLQVTSLLNYIEFLQLRQKYWQQIPGDRRMIVRAIIKICEDEKENATAALRIARLDSRMGFSCEGAGTVRGGIFTPFAIEQKLSMLEEDLNLLYTELEGLPNEG